VGEKAERPNASKADTPLRAVERAEASAQSASGAQSAQFPESRPASRSRDAADSPSSGPLPGQGAASAAEAEHADALPVRAADAGH
jgi:ribonuclease-3